MTDEQTPAATRPPAWPIIVAALALAIWSTVLVRGLSGELNAYLDQSLPFADAHLFRPLALGIGLSVPVAWGVLFIAFRRRWDLPRHLLNLTILLLVAVVVCGANLLLMGADEEEVAGRQRAVVGETVSGFANPRDANFAGQMISIISYMEGEVLDLRSVRISEDPPETWRAVCGEVSLKPGKWTGFVGLSPAREPSLKVLVNHKPLSPELRRTCLPLVRRELRGLVAGSQDARATLGEAGCGDLDLNYWQHEMTYCHGQLTRPHP